MASLEYNYALRLLWIIFSLILFGFVFFRFTQGTGKSIFSAVSIGISIFVFLYPTLFLYPILFSLLLFLAGGLYGRRKQEKYQMAEAKFEGGGIKRGLSSVEAAVILAYPLDKIILLVILGMLRKKFIYFEREESIKIYANKKMKGGNQSRKAQKGGKDRGYITQNLDEVLLRYEEPFLKLVEQDDGNELKNINFGIAFIPLVQIVAKRLAGYDLFKTMDYYRLVIQKISKEINFPENHETNSRWDFEKNLTWVLLGENNLVILDTLKIQYFPSGTIYRIFPLSPVMQDFLDIHLKKYARIIRSI